MAGTSWSPKDPDEVVSYGVNWSANLAVGDTITSSDWPNFPAGLEKVFDSLSHPVTTVRIGGGVVGQTYDVLNRVTTAGGEVLDRTNRLRIRAK